MHALEKDMATRSSVLAWRIPGTGEPGGLPSMGSHRVGHDWSDAAAATDGRCKPLHLEWINNKVLMYSTGNYIRYPVINPYWKRIGKTMCIYIYTHMYTHMYNSVTLLQSRDWHELVNQLYFNCKKAWYLITLNSHTFASGDSISWSVMCFILKADVINWI